MGGSKMLKNTSGSKVTYRHVVRDYKRTLNRCQLDVFKYAQSQQHTKIQIKLPISTSICLFSDLSQHLIILNLVAFGTADFPLQSVLVESSADVDQDSGGTGVDSTAEDHVAHARGYVHPKS